MNEFIFKDFERISFHAVNGTVLSTSKHSETHVSSSGGGGYIDRHGGRVDAPTIRSKVIEKHEFWIRKEDGSEEAIKLTNAGVSVREGQEITLIYAGHKNKYYLAILINRNAKTYHILNDAKDLNDLFKLYLVGGVWFFGAPVIWYGYYKISNDFFIGLLLALIYSAAFSLVRWSKQRKMYTALNLHLNALAKNS